MECQGRLVDITTSYETLRTRLTFEVDKISPDELERLHEAPTLDIRAVKHREKRSLDANAMLWACLGEIAGALRADKWDIYLQMLKRYGKFTYIVVRDFAVDGVKKQWRESEVVGDVMMHDAKGNEVVAKQMLCYYGTSTYDSKEFSILLDGVISEMKEIGLEPPPSADMKRAIEKLEEAERVKSQQGV